jgi:hypothetical protein
MTTNYLKEFPAMLAGLAWTVLTPAAWAVLGQASTLTANPSAPPLNATGLYTMAAVSQASGLVIKEFTGSSGVVFAVSWRGPVQPDLSALLGPYLATFQEATEAARAAGRRGSPLSVVKDGLVVQAGGRPPHFFGYAYVTHLLPAGINIKEVVQ